MSASAEIPSITKHVNAILTKFHFQKAKIALHISLHNVIMKVMRCEMFQLILPVLQNVN